MKRPESCCLASLRTGSNDSCRGQIRAATAVSGRLCVSGGQRQDDGYTEALICLVEFHQPVILADNIPHGLCSKTVLSVF